MTHRETALSFPCQFPIKIMGKAEDRFEQEVLTIIKTYVTDLKENAIATRLSRDGNFMAITVTITALDQAQLDAIYTKLNGSDQVIMTL